MAHKGRPYELAFRRDMNLNLPNNNTGWAKAYRVTLGPLGGGPGGGLTGKPFNCTPDQYSLPNGIFWTSPPEIMFGFVFVVELRVNFYSETAFARHIAIIEPVSGIIFDADYDDPQFNGTAGWPVVQYNLIFADPFFFPNPPSRITPEILALGYDGMPA